MKFQFSELDLDRTGTLVVGVAEKGKLGASAAVLDGRIGGAVGRALAASKFSGKAGEILEILAPAGIAATRVLLLGLGNPSALVQGKAEDMGGGLAAHLLSYPETQAYVAVDPIVGGTLSTGEFAAALAAGLRLRTYRFDKYRTTEKKDDKPKLAKVTLMLADAEDAKKAFASLDKVVDGVFLARDLVSEPPNSLYPESYADRMKALEKLGLTVEVLGVKEMKKLGMGALLGVGQGSTQDPRVVVMHWKGTKGNATPIAFIGKGVTFDSGGLSLKTAKGMEDMKWDMAGSAAVVGVMAALAGRKAKVNAVGIIGLVENMPSGSAQRPGDVVTSMSGQTIEVLNTDAEGRLVLADVVWYAQDRYKPKAMINLATLTGAIITALGTENAGLFASDDELADAILAAGKATGETLWRMPLAEAYDKLIKSEIADMKNIGDSTAGSIVGAQFIKRFTNNVPWAHLDIAGVAWSGRDKPVTPKGATAWGVRLLDRLVADRYEK